MKLHFTRQDQVYVCAERSSVESLDKESMWSACYITEHTSATHHTCVQRNANIITTWRVTENAQFRDSLQAYS